MKARLTDLAHLYCGEEIDSRDFAFHGECFRALNSLHSNENIVITKPDKGSGVVILNKNDFIDKMLEILDDPSNSKNLDQPQATTTLLILNQNFKNVY